MNMRTKQILQAILIGAVIPAAIFHTVEKMEIWRTHSVEIPEETVEQAEEEPFAQSIPVLQDDGTIRQIELDVYVTGVVLAEMPASFETEALKAQAVAARTYALKCSAEGNKHSGNAVCTDSSCCQAYIEISDYLTCGQQQMYEKVADSVHQTTGEVLVYAGELIDATYFSCSGGRTEDAQAVWGAQIPYLVSVESPGEEGAQHYIDTVSFSVTEFCRLLDLDHSDGKALSVGSLTYTAGGGVATLQINGVEFTGTQLRQKLGLRSTAFILTVAGETVTVTTKGFGHRVGMSQYGADAFALKGYSYREILAHYYPGTDLIRWDNN